MSNKPKIILCPYCGNTQTAPDRCEECSGRFAPRALKATQISMGPWYIRDKAMPFKPGCSYRTLTKLIEAGKVKGTTILRGPTTRQYWSLARNVPGVSHLVGYCHRCNAHVENGDVACHECATMFLPVEERNELGLQYTTEEAAQTARRGMEKDKAKRLNMDATDTNDTDDVAEALDASDISLDTDLDSTPGQDSNDSAPDDELIDDVIVVSPNNTYAEDDIEPESQAPSSKPTPKKQTPQQKIIPKVTQKKAAPPVVDDHDEADIDDGEPMITIEPQPAFAAPAAATPTAVTTIQQQPPRSQSIIWAMMGIMGFMSAAMVYLAAENSWYARQQQADAVRLSAYQNQYHQAEATQVRITDPARYDPASTATGRYANLFEINEYTQWPEPIAAEAAEAEALAKIGRPHEALIKLKEIELSVPEERRPEAIDRAISVLEQHVSAIEVPTFFGIPVE